MTDIEDKDTVIAELQAEVARLQAMITGDPELIRCSYDKYQKPVWEADFKHFGAKVLALSFADLLGDEKYKETVFEVEPRAAKSPLRLRVTVRRDFEKSPEDLLTETREENQRLRDEIEALRK